MQYSKIAFLAVVAAPFAAAQTPPACASSLIASLATSTVPGCTTGDVKCYCSNQAFITSVTTQVQSLCPPADIPAVLAYASSLCASFGVTLSVPVSVSTTSVAGSTTAAVTTTLTSTSAVISSSSSAVVSTTAAPVTSTTAVVTSTTVPKNATVTTATPTQATGAADKNTWGVAGLLGAGAAAMLMAL